MSRTIHKLIVENVKRAAWAEIDVAPGTGTVVLHGLNENGKTSILDAIWLALDNGKAKKETTNPIKNGETYAKVLLDLGDMTVLREWWVDKPSKLTVTNADGAKYSSPQGLLDGLIGKLAFDISAFIRMDDKSQMAMLLDVVDLPFVPAELAAERAGYFTERTEVNRDVKNLKAQIDGITVPDGTPTTEVDVNDLINQVRNAQNIEHQQHVALTEYEGWTEKVATLERDLAEAKAKQHTAKALMDGLPDIPDVSAIQAQIDNAQAINANVRLAQQKDQLSDQWEEKANEADALTAKMDELDKRRKDAIAAAEMPIEGLAFDDEGVTYQGQPLTQASGAGRLRVSCAMAIALNPNLRFARITDGSLLDSENLAIIDEMARDNDFTFWIETVGDPSTASDLAVVISDGRVMES